MAIALDKLLAVKAFVLGSEASNRVSRDVASRMISAAISALISSEGERDRVRLAFYHLLRSEMLRRRGDPVPDRDAAKKLCMSSHSSLYDHFMLLEESTTSRSRENGREGLLSAYGSIAHGRQSDVPSNLTRTEWRDFALRRLGEDPESLTDAEERFLSRVTLKDMLQKHAIPYAPLTN